MVSPSCAECGSKNIIHNLESGEVVCGGCGLVIVESTLYTGPEWRAFSLEESESRTRVGRSPLFSIYDKGLSTTMGDINRDGYGRRIPAEKKLQIRRLKRWQERSQVNYPNERNLAEAMSELDRLTDRLHISPNVKEEAAIIYRRALKEGLVRGRSISSMLAASLYAACRVTQTPRTLGEVARHSPIDRKEIFRCYRILLQELSLRMPVPKAERRVPRIAAKVDLGEETQQMAMVCCVTRVLNVNLTERSINIHLTVLKMAPWRLIGPVTTRRW